MCIPYHVFKLIFSLIYHLNFADEYPKAQRNVNSSKSFIHSTNVYHVHNVLSMDFSRENPFFSAI